MDESIFHIQSQNAGDMEKILNGLEWFDGFLSCGAGHVAERVRALGERILKEGALGLSGLPYLCLLMALSLEADGKSRQIPAVYGEEAMTFSLAKQLFWWISPDKDPGWIRTVRSSPFFVIHSGKAWKGGLGDFFTANRSLFPIINGDTELSTGQRHICRIEDGKGEPKAHLNELAGIKNLLAHSQDRLLHLCSSDKESAEELALCAIGPQERAMVVNAGRLLHAQDYRSLTDEIIVRCRLLHESVIVEDLPDGGVALLEDLFGESKPLFVITDKDRDLGLDGVLIKLGIPRSSERALLWEDAFGAANLEAGASLSEIAKKYRLSTGEIRTCAKNALSRKQKRGGDVVTMEDIRVSVSERGGGRLDALSTRLPLVFTFDDLVVGDKERAVMETLCQRVKNKSLVDEEWGFDEKIPYGKGVSLILYGPPGTGKTMAAQVMAGEIGMPLYRVDLSQLVDKYIGETQKNIGRVFDAARDANVILFFDEADSLFAKRTEVSNSNDRQANSEVAYLLQRVEQHDGVVFLATNRFGDFDKAFIRRINYAVRLERPDSAKRLELYQKIIPEKMPVDDMLDLEFFAENFEMSGSEIKEAIYSAAFIAASENAPFGNRHIAIAIKYQQEKTGKLVSPAEFGRYAHHVI